MTEGELEKRLFTVMESEYQLHKTEESLRRSYTNTLGEFRRILDEAAKDIMGETEFEWSKVCVSCHWNAIEECLQPNYQIYYQKPDDCPLRRLEKWFGEQK